MSRCKAATMDDIAEEIEDLPHAAPATTPPPAPSVLLTLAIDSIDANGPWQTRKARPSAQDDAGLASSIRTLGILTPIVVVESFDAPGRYQVIDGHRRVAAARASGLASIPAVFGPQGEGDDARRLAAGVASNLQRVGVDPVDQWRAITRLQAEGYSLAGASQALGLEERLAKRLDKLGRLHPDVLAAIEGHGMPPYRDLAQIASAPLDVQAAALARKDAWRGSGKKREACWWGISAACITQRIPRERALFDTAKAGVVFEEDLFAEPGADEQFTTTDVEGFLQCQQAALDAMIEKSDGRIIAIDAKDGDQGRLPKGWQSWYNPAAKFDDPATWPAEASWFVCIVPSGYGIGTLRQTLAIRASRAKSAAHTADGEDAGDDAGEAAAPPKPRGPLTRKGEIMIGQAKTAAIRTALLDRVATGYTEGALLRMMVLCLAAQNVTVNGDPTSRFQHTDFRDLAAKILDAEGKPRDLDNDDQNDEEEIIKHIACEAIARILVCGPTESAASSGAAAEWIGAWIDAERTLPPLDTPELLAQVSADTLREAATAAGIDTKGSTKQLRERLAGNLSEVRWPGATFGAPCEAPPPEDEDEEATLPSDAPPVQRVLAAMEEVLSYSYSDSAMDMAATFDDHSIEHSEIDDLVVEIADALGVKIPDAQLELITGATTMQDLADILVAALAPEEDGATDGVQHGGGPE